MSENTSVPHGHRMDLGGAGATGRVYAFAFLESLSTVLLERGLYFYTHDLLGFSETGNLALALCFGITYVGGALASHPIAARIGEKRAVVASVAGLFLLHAALWVHHTSLFITVSFALVALLQGFKWPLIETYVSAGHAPAKILTNLGRFNVSWAVAVPAALVVTGPIVGSRRPELLFALAAAINLAALWLTLPWPTRPIHLADDHPDRPAPHQLARLTALLVASRWSMLASYALLFLLAPLMPGIFERLHVPLSAASASSSALDVVRLLAFALLGAFPGWHGKVPPLVAAMIGLPVGFALVLFGPTIPLVLLGELLFGAAAGLVYYAALYYALVVKNASVDAGGAHEGLIGLGFALGPLLGLVGYGAAESLGSYVSGMLCGVMPMLAVCGAAAARALVKAARIGRLAE
jgi:MFS family permease